MTTKILNITGYIIKNTKRNSIWKDIYMTNEGALAELNSQKKMLPKGFTANNWKIESFTYQARVEDTDKKDFAEFN